MKKQNQHGFTLVEIAIVLVIIGLLLGRILKGQEMITQAKIKNVIADLSGVSAAMYGYQDRYKALPGDDKGAAGRWLRSLSAGSRALNKATMSWSVTKPMCPTRATCPSMRPCPPAMTVS